MSTECAAGAPTSGLSILIEWANGQDHWIRRLVAEVVETRRRLSDDAIDAIYTLNLLEKELVDGEPPHVELLSGGGTAPVGRSSIRLLSLEHVEGVNALEPNQKIEFHPRLTVCFGENASGKTGYVRVLKRAAAVRTAEPVLSNIRQPGARSPQARIEVQVAEEARTIDWFGDHGLDPLTRVDVFDARVAVAHLAEDLTYSYTPADLSLFPLVSDGIERVQAKLENARVERRPRSNPFLSRFARESTLYAKIEGLGPSTDLEQLELLATVPEGDEEALAGLREKVGALRSGSVRAEADRAEHGRECESPGSIDRKTARSPGSLIHFARIIDPPPPGHRDHPGRR